jgi:1D-myo-inositol-tetrakisphosphate 5-kinase/inositol-polyphosphate multikinase
VFEFEGHKLIAMEDMCKPYKKACVMDCKMGYTTVYPWGPEKYVTKNSAKDLENTSSTVGFRVSGLRCYRPAEGEMFKPDRHWGKTLNADNIGSAFELFASGALGPKELYGDAEFGVLAQLRKLQQWVHSQTSVQMYQASVLLMYEGDCTCVADANVRVAVVDFAHTFQSLGQKDENWIKALDNLIAIVEKVVSS